MKEKISALHDVLRRIGGQIQELKNITRSFIPSHEQPRRDRVYGTLHTHDANVRIGFYASRISLQTLRLALMTVSGKVWLDETTSGLTAMIREYKLMEANNSQERA